MIGDLMASGSWTTSVLLVSLALSLASKYADLGGSGPVDHPQAG